MVEYVVPCEARLWIGIQEAENEIHRRLTLVSHETQVKRWCPIVLSRRFNSSIRSGPLTSKGWTPTSMIYRMTPKLYMSTAGSVGFDLLNRSGGQYAVLPVLAGRAFFLRPLPSALSLSVPSW